MKTMWQQKNSNSNSNYNYNEVINKLQHYIICEKYIHHVKHQLNKKSGSVKTTTTTTTTTPTPAPAPVKKNDIFYPKDQDPLYWIFYIMQHGLMDYQYNKNKRFILEKEKKISYIENIKDHKPIIKMQKIMSLSDFENNMVVEKKININAFLNLCAIEKLNVIIIRSKIYYELLTTDSDDIYIVYNTKYNSKSANYDKFGFELCKKNSEKWNKIKTTYVQTNNILNPIKSVSYYKLDDLINMASKFGLPTVCPITKKNKRKNQLYEDIILHIS